MVGNNSKSTLVVGLLVGAATGTAAALLMAPTTGKHSRELLRQKTSQIAGTCRNRLKRTPVAINDGDSDRHS